MLQLNQELLAHHLQVEQKLTEIDQGMQVGQTVAYVLSDKKKNDRCHPEFICNQLRVMEVLHSMSATRI